LFAIFAASCAEKLLGIEKMTTKSCSLLIATLILLSLAGALDTPAVAQSTPTHGPGVASQEDFYQPVQELWNQPATESPDISSRFAPSDTLPVPTDSSTRSYTQEGPYAEIPARCGACAVGRGEAALSDGTSSPTSSPLTDQIPILTQTIPPAAQIPILAETIPPGVTMMAPTTTAPVTAAIESAYPSTRTMFFRWDYMLARINNDDDGVIGSPNDAGSYVSNGIPFPFANSLDTNAFDSNSSPGFRIELGELDDNGGWMIGFLDWDGNSAVNAPGGSLQFNDPDGVLLGYADNNGDSIDDDLDGDNVYGRDGIDLGTPDPLNPGMFLPIFDGVIDASAPADDDDLVTWVPVFEDLDARSKVNIFSIEVMKAWRRHQSAGPYGFARHWLGGIRYIDLDDYFSLDGSGSFFDSMAMDASIRNIIVGPQVGMECARRVGDIRVGGTFRFLLGLNFQRGLQSGSYATNVSPGEQNQPLNLNPGSFSSGENNVAVSPVLDWRLDAAYDIGKHFAARIGYTGMFIGGIGRAANSIEYTLPSFGLSVTDDDVMVLNAFTAGIEIYF
jgi:hypothetical protein